MKTTHPQGFSFPHLLPFCPLQHVSVPVVQLGRIHSFIHAALPTPITNDLQRDARKRKKENAVTPVACLLTLLFSGPAGSVFKDEKQKKKNYTSTSIHTCSAYVCGGCCCMVFCVWFCFLGPLSKSGLFFFFGLSLSSAPQQQLFFFPYERTMTTTHATFVCLYQDSRFSWYTSQQA